MMHEDRLTHRQRVRLESLARAQSMPTFENPEEQPTGTQLRQRIYAIALEIEQFLLQAEAVPDDPIVGHTEPKSPMDCPVGWNAGYHARS